FDLAIRQARAATGEVQLGELLYAGLDRGGKKVQLVRWGENAETGKGGEWYEASGVGERRGMMAMPVAGHMTSNYGMRFHPILQMMRMHKGLDIGAPYGSPIRAAMDGIVQLAGRNAGYGNFVKLAHGGGLATGYGHMSRIAVNAGAHVTQGQIIGYVGSTGLSTGPHLHYEVWRNGVSVNPHTMSFTQVAQLSGEALRAFKARVAALLSVKPGAR
ncbi:MAG: M23 family metallopeptidase, partial [Sphingomonas sp.]|nr:M23 family metallopeptidase [Sphingomonas sp.]